MCIPVMNLEWWCRDSPSLQKHSNYKSYSVPGHARITGLSAELRKRSTASSHAKLSEANGTLGQGRAGVMVWYEHTEQPQGLWLLVDTTCHCRIALAPLASCCWWFLLGKVMSRWRGPNWGTRIHQAIPVNSPLLCMAAFFKPSNSRETSWNHSIIKRY